LISFGAAVAGFSWFYEYVYVFADPSKYTTWQNIAIKLMAFLVYFLPTTHYIMGVDKIGRIFLLQFEKCVKEKAQYGETKAEFFNRVSQGECAGEIP